MRKILAALLAVMMIVSLVAALPAGAETTTYESKFDGTTSNIEFGLIVTEFCVDTSISNNTSINVDTDTSCYQYLEIYNGGTDPVNLYDLAIVSTSDPITATTGWKMYKNFKAENGGKKITLAPGPIYNQVSGLTAPTDAKLMVENPDRAEALIEPGEFGVIWFWSSECASVSNTEGACLAADAKDRAKFPRFRDHYAKLMNVQKFRTDDPTKETEEYQALQEVPIVVAMANESLSEKVFDLDHTNYIYGLVDKDFDIEASIVDNVDAGKKLYCEFGFTVNSRHGIIAKTQDAAITLVPSNANPDLLNAVAELEAELIGDGAEATLYPDYVQAGKSLSYYELGMLSIADNPTIGSMSAIQWSYVDPDMMAQRVADGDTFVVSDWATNNDIRVTVGEGADQEIKLATDWAEKAVAAAVAKIMADKPADSVDRNETSRDEDSNLLDQDFWEGQQGSNVNKNNNKKKGLDTWVIILIIVAGVVVVAGAAVAVILILKKKNKPVAADDVSTEGDVEVIDETAAEAPAEEEKKEE